MTGIITLVAQIIATVDGMSTLAEHLIKIFQVDESKLRAKLAENHQITDEKADNALAKIGKTWKEAGGT